MRLLPCLGLLLLSACGGGGGSSSSADALAAPASTPPPAVNTPPAAVSGTEIKVLALTTPGASSLYADVALRLTHLLNVSNDVLASAGAPITLTLAGQLAVTYPDDLPMDGSLDDLTFGSHPSLAQVAAWRNAAAADLVVLFRPYANDGRCGLAWVGAYRQDGDFAGYADYGFAVVAINCSDYTLLHEIGHNLGLAHSRREEPGGGSFPWAAGYGVDGGFVTIMASPDVFNAPRLPRLATPEQRCDGLPCGVDYRDQSQGADAVRALTLAREQVAGYRD